jgi:hypothetical protein
MGPPSGSASARKASTHKPTHKEETDEQRQEQEAEADVNRWLDLDAKLELDSVKSRLAYAKNIKDAKNDLEKLITWRIPTGIRFVYDRWNEFQKKCKVGASAVSKYLGIAESKPINDPKNLKYLPASVSTLYELSGLRADQFDKLPKSLIEKAGTLNPAITRDKAKVLIGKPPNPSRDPAKNRAEKQQREQDRQELMNLRALAIARKANAATQRANAGLMATTQTTEDAAGDNVFLSSAPPAPKKEQPAQPPAAIATISKTLHTGKETEEQEPIVLAGGFTNPHADTFVHVELPDAMKNDRIIANAIAKLKAETASLPPVAGYSWDISITLSKA